MMIRGGFGGLRRARSFWTSNRRSERFVRFPARSLPFSDEFSVLGLTPLASKSDVKQAYKRLALKYHPDVIRGDNLQEKHEVFKEIKSAYEILMDKFEVQESQVDNYDEFDEWEEWMGFEGGIPVVYSTF